MKILVINWQDWTNPLSGGAEAHLHEIFSRIVDEGHSVSLLCCSYDNAPSQEIIDGITIYRRGSRLTFNIRAAYEYLRNFKKQSFDVIIDDINKIPFFTPVYVREPVIAICHHLFGTSIFLETGWITGTYVFLMEKLIGLIYKKTLLLIVSQSTKDELLEKRFKSEQLFFAMNGIDTRRFQKGVIKSDHPTIGYVGRLKKYKRVDHIIRAFALLLPKVPTAILLIVGRGDYEGSLRELAKTLGIEKSIRFIGFISEEEKIELLQTLWVVVNASIKEGWGIVNAEANACGTPAVAADVPGLRDSVVHNKTGLLFPSGDILMLSQTLELIIRNDELRTSLAQGGIEFAKSLQWDNAVASTLKVLTKVVSPEQIQ